MTINQTDKPEKFKLGEMGHIGLKTSNGTVLEEMKKDLQFPYSVRTYKQMSYDPSIASAFTIIQDVIRTLKWDVKAGSSEEHAKFIKTCMDDMEDSWDEVINEALSILMYGFQVTEKVFKFRTGQSGKYKSKYNDNLIGWAKLSPRSQATLDKWVWKDEGRTLAGVRQNLTLVPQELASRFSGNSYQTLPRKKFLLFTHNRQRGNPEGQSPLSRCYVPWKYKTEIENYEAIGISRQFTGFPDFGFPPDYLSPDADEDKKAVVEWAQQFIENFNSNEQAGLIRPRFIDPDTKEDMFYFDLKTVNGSAVHDTNKVVDRYESKILMVFLADVLKLGQSSVGSFALADAKTNLLAIRIAAILKQIVNVFNNDLIPHTFRLNGWDDAELPQIVHGDLEELSLDELGKFIQRSVSVGAMEVDKELSGFLRERVRVDKDPEGELEDKFLPAGSSRAGDGMKAGTTGNGTAKQAGGGDTSTSNSENKG